MWGGGGGAGGGALIIGCFFCLFVLFFCQFTSYNLPDEILLLVDFIFRGGKKCTFSTLSDRLFSFSVFLLNLLSVS